MAVLLLGLGIMQQSLYAQNRPANNVILKGLVTDVGGKYLQDVAVSVLDLNGRAVATGFTDTLGVFLIQGLRQDSMYNVVFSLIGYKPVKVEKVLAKNNVASLLVQLPANEALQKLNEVVVVAYGNQKKDNIIQAVTSVNKEIVTAPVSKISSSLAGKVAGVIAVQRTGEPGAGSTFWIRGISTMTNASPLVLVDGIERNMDLVDPEDIDQISVLKDASATSIYGVKGANGVILITTRTGKPGPITISAKVENGILTPTKIPKMINASQFANMYNEAVGFSYYPQEALDKYKSGKDPDLYPNVDWIKTIYKDYTNNQRIVVDINGGTQQARYYVSGTAYSEKGLYNIDNLKSYNTANYYRRYTFRSNLDIQLFKHTTFNINLNTAFERKNDPGSSNSTIWDYAIRTSPNSFPTVYSNGKMPGPGSNQGWNPYALLTQSGYVQQFWFNGQSLFGITQDLSPLTKGLSFNIQASFDAQNYTKNSRTRQVDEWLATGRDEDGNLIMNQKLPGEQSLKYAESNNGMRRFYVLSSINYSRTFAKHRVDGLVLFQQSELFNIGVSTSDDALPYKNQGIAGRFNYAYNGKYLVEGSFGYNGSENFAPGHRFGLFPALALGWHVSNEQFFTGLKEVVSNLKLRGSYGKVGSDNIGGDRRFAYIGTIGSGTTQTGMGTAASNQNTIYIKDWANPNVGWETALKLDVGAEMTFFRKLDFKFDYFKENRSGIFLQRASIPNYAGVVNSPYVNIGEMRNSGVEFSLQYNQKIGEVSLSGLGNFTFARNIILNKDEPTYDQQYLYSTGQARYQSFGYVAAGIFQSQAEIDAWPKQEVGATPKPGDIKYLDLNGDGVVNYYDRKPIGYTNIPEIVYGFGISSKWRNWDLSFFFQGNSHVNFLYNSEQVVPFSNSNMNQNGIFADVYGNYWKPDHTDAKYPRIAGSSNSNNNVASTFWMADGSYLRLKNIEFGYTFSKALLTRLHLKNTRIYFSGVNILTISKFKLWDPDLQVNGSVFPPNKTFSIGISTNIN
ncbi:SusC/RagA family TonB-linked outer membrane protein [Chitinophaga sp. Cy-1792]|uniref:SusC/RagA family TonB-linked outer membrane protein n=1 Tax=Chitinophaga sp. Cy-1792 TaxID=2608339 RepID=UPI001421B355|nr:SusC/RagA family TonB-linked outer membrane protein [Chitinophaga sp. Cy-1792]